MPTYSEFWGDYSLLVNRNPRRNSIRRTVNRDSFRVATELFDTLIGAAVGATAAATHKRVGNQFSNTPGNNEAVVVTVTDINRPSTAADVAFLKEMVFNVKTAPNYPADKSGNGGGALVV